MCRNSKTLQNAWRPAAGLYLLVLGALFLWGLYREWPRCDFDSDCASAPAKTAPPMVVPASPEKPPRVESANPSRGDFCGSRSVTLIGEGFVDKATVVEFGGVPALGVTVQAGGRQLTAISPPHAEGPVDLTVRVGAASTTIESKFTYVCRERSQRRLLLLVIFAGALGGIAHGIRSFSTHAGKSDLSRNWAWYYLMLPLVGALLSVLFFLVFVGGLFSPESSNGGSYFLMVGASALVGMFSPQASEKLKKIAEAVFSTAPDAAATKELVLRTLEPATGAVSGGDEVVLKGAGFQDVTSVSFNDVAAPSMEIVDDNTIRVKTPRGIQGKAKVVVHCPNGLTERRDLFAYV